MSYPHKTGRAILAAANEMIDCDAERFPEFQSWHENIIKPFVEDRKVLFIETYVLIQAGFAVDSLVTGECNPPPAPC
jgi:hypothetical protein